MVIKINSIEKYINVLKCEYDDLQDNIFYRGQSNVDFELCPSIFRDDLKNTENKEYNTEDKIYLKVLTEYSNEFDRNMLHIDIISKMQHYGIPTRLLDVTTNSLIALYFACDDKENMNKDGCVCIFKVDEKNIKQFDSDTISILSSIPRFNDGAKRKLFRLAEGNPTIQEFNKQKVVRRLLHEIKKEKPAFENIINPNDLLSNYFVLPKKDNTRIIRQNGAFIIFGLNYEDENKNRKIKCDKKIIIEKNSKKDILNHLKYLGISKTSVYPELYKAAEYIKDSIKENTKDNISDSINRWYYSHKVKIDYSNIYNKW